MSFGIIISGRPILTDAQKISETQVAFHIPSTPPFSHIVVFLLPGVALPDSTAAAVYAQLPHTSDFVLLGAIANEKPSAIFKIHSKTGGLTDGGLGDEDVMTDDGSTIPPNGAMPTLTLGISVEPAAQVAANLSQKKTSAPPTGNEIVLRSQSVSNTKVLAQRIIKNCYDFLTSWGTGDQVPLKAFQAWWTKFESKLDHDPGFLERREGV